ncbi:hypothetical protein GOZ78_17835 [Agrobacterium vitis]|uniref:DUF3102 domain-containing protein n=1 Tax=Agrobacterium vitis TaxID=373 RepID=A0ABD6GIW4_AGRVI|nr:hypothetical protein [Agrobacterium vitis]MUO79698.1 hypothetical protein [Agrobacterium vitis]MUO96850.1 hypothetical protein [Agrobacterium vitis]MUP07689.1 hypothetical protein [Agrobacterium vitis]MUZ83627.1 hypothetical protein [Agrobacterium vitis]MVA11882.1 hypothetical protein [Agrobacterium vitis]
MAASSFRKPSAADLAALDEALADLDLSGTTSSAPLAPASAASSTHISPLPVGPAVLTTPPTELEAFYRPMDKTQAEKLQAVAARIKERDRIARIGIIETGNDLIAIKNSISGQFDRWLKVEFDMSKATAWNYINAALQFGSAPKVVEVLPPGTVYKLAAKTTPVAVRNKVVAEIESGATLLKDEVERRIAVARNLAANEERTRKQAEREQMEADRRKREEDDAWQLRAKELAEAGKPDDEVLMERKKWDAAEEAKLRANENAKQKREEEEQRRRCELQAENVRKEHDAKRVANWLLISLGRDKFEEFRSELSVAIAGSERILRAIEGMEPASIHSTNAPVAEKTATTEAADSEAGTVSVKFGSF